LDLSILITNYNYQDYIQKSIESCLNQNTSFNYEIVVVDDGSTDNSIERIKQFKEKIKFFSIKNSGIEKASNFGINKCNGEYITRLDADDFLKPSFIQSNLELLKNSTATFAYSNYDAVNYKDDVLWNMKLPSFNEIEIFQRGDFLATGTVYLKSQIALAGYFNETTKNCGLENYELIIKILKSGAVGLLNEQNLFCYRIHNKNMSSIRRNSIIEYGKKITRLLLKTDYMTNRYHPYKLILDA
jgi:glycosyltransferase involved in cell wall biosynthesis